MSTTYFKLRPASTIALPLQLKQRKHQSLAKKAIFQRMPKKWFSGSVAHAVQNIARDAVSVWLFVSP